jgi:hypothetical protein
MIPLFEGGPLDYILVTDESGNDSEPLQVLAGVSGRRRDLAELEIELKALLRRHGVRELKWSGVRKRKERHAAALGFLKLACERAAEGKLWVDLAVLGGDLSLPWRRLSGRERWMALYQGLILRARRRAPRRGSWSLLPDQRTGMPWKRLGRLAGLGSVVELNSGELALVQLADLLAGLTRFSHLEAGSAAPEAWRLRQGLLEAFREMLRAGGLGSLQSGRGARGAFRLWKARNLKRGSHEKS